jgi:hypothetical protein
MDFDLGDSYQEIKNKLGNPNSTQSEEGGMSIIYNQGAYSFGYVSNLSDLKDDAKAVMVGINSINDVTYY